MSSGADILDGFFSSSAMPFTPGGNGGQWAGEQRPPQQQQQQQQQVQPHTPNSASPDATTVTTSGSSSSQSGDKSSGAALPSSGHAEYSTSTPAGLHTNRNNDNSSNVYPRGDRMARIHALSSAAASSSNQAYAGMPATYATVMPQHLAHQQMQLAGGISMPLNAAAPQPLQSKPEEARMPDGALQAVRGSDVMLERLLACLSECKGMASLQLQVAETTTPSPAAAAVLSQLVAHLEEDRMRLLQLRGVFVPSAVMSNGVTAYHNMAVDASKDRLAATQPHLSNTQQHQQQHQYPTDANGTPLFGAPAAAAAAAATAAAASFYDRPIWCFPETRNAHNKNSGMDFVEEGSSAGAAMKQHPKQQQQQPPHPHSYNHLDVGMAPSGQMMPYMGGGGVAAAAYQASNAPLLGAGEDPSAMYAAPAEVAPSLLDTSMGNRSRGPPRRVVEQPQPAAEGEDAQKFLAFVEFKRHRVRKYECALDITPGQYVMVDGDRGRDCGLLVQTMKTLPDGTSALFCMDGSHVNADKIKLEKGRVLGVATTEEIDYLHNTMQRAERVALETCKKVCNDMGIDINLQDCEYQFDMEKVSFYFNSEHSIDFRPLVRELYRMFRVRIWMENTNPHVKNAMPVTDAAGSSSNNNNNNNNNNADDAAAAGEGGANGDSKKNNSQNHSNYNNNNNNSKHGGPRRRGPRWAQKNTQLKDDRN